MIDRWSCMIYVFILSATVATGQPATPWAPTECNAADFGKRIAERAREVRESTRPNLPLYTPYPLTRKGHEAIEVLVDHISLSVKRKLDTSDATSEETQNALRLLSLIEEDNVQFAVYRSAQWRPKLRCDGPGQFGRWSFFIRGYNKATGREIFRGTVDEFGLPRSWLFKTGTWADEPLMSIYSLEQATSLVSEFVGARVSNAQYVEAVGGASLYCTSLFPCIAMRGEKDVIYLLQSPDLTPNAKPILFQIEGGAANRFYSGHANEGAPLPSLPNGQAWVTTGGSYSAGERLGADDFDN
jgi:hypothetical protein